MAKRKGFTWTRKKAWAICKGTRVVTTDSMPLLYPRKDYAEEFCTSTETVRPCEIVVKVKGDTVHRVFLFVLLAFIIHGAHCGPTKQRCDIQIEQIRTRAQLHRSERLLDWYEGLVPPTPDMEKP